MEVQEVKEYDVALWRRFDGADLPLLGSVREDEVDTPHAALEWVMQGCGLSYVAHAAVGCPDGLLFRWGRGASLSAGGFLIERCHCGLCGEWVSVAEWWEMGSGVGWCAYCLSQYVGGFSDEVKAVLGAVV